MGGKIKARFIIQIAGKPFENVMKALEIVLKQLKEKKEDFTFISGDIEKPELDEETTLYSGFLDVTLEFDGIEFILDFILNYTPSSVEVEEPEEIEMTNGALTGVLNELTNIILNSNNEVRKLRAQVHILNKKLEEKQK